nr:hypothetical protein [Tanacetum cinerariifolium]
MSTSKFAETHNLVAFLKKPTKSEGFEKIIDFFNASYVKYALMVNPTVYTLCIEQFWASAKVKNVNGEAHIQALVDKKKVIITEASIRRELRFKDERGVDCLSNEVILEQLTFMGANSSARETQQLSSGNSFALTVAKYSSSGIFITDSGNDFKHFIPNTYFIYE